MERLREAIEIKGKSALKALGADVEIVDITIDGWVKVRLSVTSTDYYDDRLLVRALEGIGILTNGFPGVKGVVPAIVIWQGAAIPSTERPL